MRGAVLCLQSVYVHMNTILSVICNLPPFVAPVINFLSSEQGDNGLPGPRGPPGVGGEAGKNVG